MAYAPSVFWLLLHACGPGQPPRAPEGTPAELSLHHLEELESHAEELREVGQRIEELQQELGDESRQREEVLSDLDAQVERARELSGLIDQDLEGAEAVLRSPNPTE